MGSESSSEEEISDSDIETYSENLYDQLKNNDLVVDYIRNEAKLSIVRRKGLKTNVVQEDGNFRCPICLGKKKQLYGYTDLLQHASGSGKGSGKAKLKAAHLAIAKYLRIELSPAPHFVELDYEPVGLALPKAGEVQVSEGCHRDGLFAVPWTGILVNLSSVSEGGQSNIVLGSHLNQYLIKMGFNTNKVKVLWNPEQWDSAPRRQALVSFNNGFENAMLFQKAFEATGHRKGDWSPERHQSTDVFGWVAGKDDLQKHGVAGAELRKRCELRSIAEVEADKGQHHSKPKPPDPPGNVLGKRGHHHADECNEQDQPTTKRSNKEG